jgi:hypothetical protein
MLRGTSPRDAARKGSSAGIESFPLAQNGKAMQYAPATTQNFYLWHKLL